MRNWFVGFCLFGLAVARADTLVLNPDLVIELALKNNTLLQVNREKVQEAAAGKGAALGNMFPQISVTGSYTRLGTLNEFELITPVYARLPLRVYDPRTGEIIGFTDSIPLPVGADTMHMPLGSRDNYLLRASVQQTVFTWGKLINAYRIAGLSLEAQRAAEKQAEEETKIQVLEGFYRAFLAERTLQLLEESYEQLQRHTEQVEKLYENGLAGRLDLMRTRVGLTNMANQVSQMANNAGLARFALCNLLGIPTGTPLVLQAEMTEDTLVIDTTGVLDTALQRRTELTQLRCACEMADIGVRIARTANLPTLFAAANFDYKRPVGFNDRWDQDWNATIGFSLPVFTGLSNLNKLKQAQSKYRQAVLSLKMVEDAVQLEVSATLASMNQEKKNIAYQRENVKMAEEAYRLAEERYQNGFLTNLEFLDTQLQLTQSRVAYLSALANYQVAKAKFLRAIGKF
ncbi:MAG: TolC family protein [bacterium]